jgi:hypothetical protein
MTSRFTELAIDCADPNGLARYDTELWMRDLKEGAAYLPK